jgi:hypothetical protein
MIATIIGAIWPYLLAGAGLLAGVVATMFARKTTQTAKAQVSAAQAGATAEVRTEQVAEAQANSTAAQAGATAVQARTDTDTTVAAKPAGEVKNELDAWTK